MDNMHQLSLDILDIPDDVIMTGTLFAKHIPWPEGRPSSQWGVTCTLMIDDEQGKQQEDLDSSCRQQQGEHQGDR